MTLASDDDAADYAMGAPAAPASPQAADEPKPKPASPQKAQLLWLKAAMTKGNRMLAVVEDAVEKDRREKRELAEKIMRELDSPRVTSKGPWIMISGWD